MSGIKHLKKPDLQRLHQWVLESQWVHRAWRQESWRDAEFYDGQQWGSEAYTKAKAAGIEPITINRIFPVVNLIMGANTINPMDITAEGRTHKDGEMEQIASEGIAYVMDQHNGHESVNDAFADQIIPGFGCVQVGFSSDPRIERIKIVYRDWKEIWWDSFGSAWLNPETCRYVFHQRWMDIDDLIAFFPSKAKDIKDQYDNWRGQHTQTGITDHDILSTIFEDEASYVEQEKRLNASYWGDYKRNRVRPVQMWYIVFEKAFFARFRDGRVFEIKEDMPPMEQFGLIQESKEVVEAVVRRVWTTTFLGDIILQDVKSPYGHDQFPFIPFVGYIDRFGFPYGVPRQIRGQNIEVNNRRSMALQLLKTRRTMMEENAIGGEGGKPAGKDAYQKVYEEVNRPDGFVIVRPGKLDAIRIDEQIQLAPAQVQLMEQSEREIAEISGANNERMGISESSMSGRAIEVRQQQGSQMTAQLFEHKRRSLKRIGEQILALMQQTWTSEKVLRITDRLSGSRRWVALNEPALGPGGTIVLRNDITQGRYDIKITESPATDTVRERYANLLMETMKKSPPEAIPYLWTVAIEMLNIPNKERILSRLRPLFGMSPDEEDLGPEELKARAKQEAEAKAQTEAMMQQIQQQGLELENKMKMAEIEKLTAEIARIYDTAKTQRAKVVADIQDKQEKSMAAHDNVKVNAFRAETEASVQDNNAKMRELELLQDEMQRQDEKEARKKERSIKQDAPTGRG